MDMIRKGSAPPHEQCDTASETKPVAQQELPAQPLDRLFPFDASVPQANANTAGESAPDSLPTYPPLFRRIRPRQRRLATPASVGTPDWKLSTGAAVVLLGFAIAFGTYITLTQRDAMQSRLRRIVTQNELRAMPRQERPTIADRTQELARSLRNQIETLRGRDAADTAVVAGAAVHQPANAHSSKLASSTPSLPAATATSPPPVPASQGKAHAKQLAAKPLAPPLPQPAPRARQLASATPTRAHSTTPTQQERKTSAKQANTACGPRSPCVQTVAAQSSRKPANVASKTVPAKAGTKTVAVRRTPLKTAAKPVQRPLPPTVQAWSPPETPATLPASEDTEIYRQH
ncbi:hypothetical protein [Burkholderia sp. Ac-20365]|uniref:hypothetical protein n=1 Tax=Burkholderia sp. Ac-20365 TaxID=2703897 RepID=UPI00197C69C8|nr:hypothetical protein [Burkholderia sp. Ac-20365]MBN3767903.1 hypothetical protein [Burkholderia sp. Ac-20365]